MSIFDIIKRNVLLTWFIGFAYFIFFFVFNFVSNFLVFLPYIVRLIFILGGGFILAMFFIWKISVGDGYDYEHQKVFDKKQYLLWMCIALVADAVLFLVLYLLGVRFIYTCYSLVHFHGCFPGSLFAELFKIPSDVGMLISVFLDLPIIIAVRYKGLCHGSKVMLAERELLDEAKKNSSKILKKRQS